MLSRLLDWLDTLLPMPETGWEATLSASAVVMCRYVLNGSESREPTFDEELDYLCRMAW